MFRGHRGLCLLAGDRLLPVPLTRCVGGGGPPPPPKKEPCQPPVNLLQPEFPTPLPRPLLPPSPCPQALGAAAAGAAKLTIIHVTDVYLLDNFPHLRTLVAEKKQANPNTISVLTGDFLAPYLLSSLDHGAAMMAMITGTPIDYLTWGNHEADVGHEHVKRRVMEYHAAGGVWLNSNMQSHETMEYNKDCEVITVKSPDGSQSRYETHWVHAYLSGDVRYAPTRRVLALLLGFVEFRSDAPYFRWGWGGICILFEICEKRPFQKCMG